MGLVERADIRQDWAGDAVYLRAYLRDGRQKDYRITAHELAMDSRAARYWIETIDNDIWQSVGRFRPQQWNTEERERHARQMAGAAGYFFRQNPAAEKRAKELFISIAGKAAFDTLEAGGALPITGSAGTAYTLHKRSSYCVQRVSDGAKLCAVVPGVPLWDHLLGIKLMVEQDEPRFLAKANVSAGASSPYNVRHPMFP